MCRQDIAEVTEIDQEAFPSLWPPANYERELESRLSHYIVACNEREVIAEPETKASPKGNLSVEKRLFNWSGFFSRGLHQSGKKNILGFAGFWMMAGEAHITSIAVRKPYRRRGIGELLLISLIELASELQAQVITLEVRISNIAAQSLYCKYGFTGVGLRRNYYTDDGEDALLMTAESITSASFQARFQQLQETHFRKWRMPLHQIT